MQKTRNTLMAFLTFQTGSIDALSFLTLGGVFSSFMSGNTAHPRSKNWFRGFCTSVIFSDRSPWLHRRSCTSGKHWKPKFALTRNLATRDYEDHHCRVPIARSIYDCGIYSRKYRALKSFIF